MAELAPIAKGWVSTTGETGAQNYDEFADDTEITAIVEANPRSMLAVEMAHCTPEMLAEGAAVRDAVEEVVRSRPPTVTSRDQKGSEHRVRVVSEPPERDRLLDALEGKELLVADGNHRSRASEHAGLDAFFAVVLSAETMHIDEYHRGFHELGMDDEEFLARVREAGFDVGETGTIELYSRSGRHGLTPRVERRQAPETLEHQLVEERIVRSVLGWDPKFGR